MEGLADASRAPDSSGSRRNDLSRQHGKRRLLLGVGTSSGLGTTGPRRLIEECRALGAKIHIGGPYMRWTTGADRAPDALILAQVRTDRFLGPAEERRNVLSVPIVERAQIGDQRDEVIEIRGVVDSHNPRLICRHCGRERWRKQCRNREEKQPSHQAASRPLPISHANEDESQTMGLSQILPRDDRAEPNGSPPSLSRVGTLAMWGA
jgi:hypothetical protein